MNDTSKGLVIEQDKLLAAQPVNDAVTMLAAIGQMAVDPDVDIEKVERLMALQFKMQDRESETAFNAALSAAQSEMGVIIKNKHNTQTSSNYADLGAIVKDITPVYTSHGLNMSFDSGKAEGDIIPIICRVSACGHTRTYHYDSPITDKGIKGAVMMTAAHARGSAISYGRRYLTCMIFNIATADDDGNAATPEEIELITPEQAADLHSLLEEHNMKDGRLLKYYNAAAKVNISRISDIQADWYEKCAKKIQGAAQ